MLQDDQSVSAEMLNEIKETVDEGTVIIAPRRQYYLNEEIIMERS